MESSSGEEEDSSDYSEANNEAPNEAQNDATIDGTIPKVAAGQVEETEIQDTQPLDYEHSWICVL